MTTLATFQQAFWQALWATDTGSAPAWTRQPAFTVYRNTVLKGCTDNLLALYPAVCRLTGEDWLRAVALAYARAHPPSDGRLHAYGESFPAFIAQALPAGELPWLHDVARLDRLWMDCHTAADAPGLQPEALTRYSSATLDTARLQPHPAARWHRNGQWPVFDLWRAAREAWPDPNPEQWQGQCVLFTRPVGAVRHTAIGFGACALLDACGQGLTIPEAMAAALSADPALDLGATLGLLLTQGAFAQDPP
jgi:hypothetical protein